MSAYLQHLAQVNDIQPVYAACDILSRDGEVLLSKGSPLDHDAAQRLANTELGKNIEYCITLEQEFDLAFITQIFITFISSDVSLNSIFELRDLNDKFEQALLAFSEEKILCQKLNILAIQLPDIFDQSFFCAWMALAILAHENQPQERLNEAFIASLSHDLGLLHISPDILFKQGPLNADEWQHMQEHVLFSVKILKEMTRQEKTCARAVIEHHEFIDGTGYPKGKLQQQTSALGKLLQLLDSLNAIYRKQYKPRNRTLRDMIPLIQMTTLSRGGVHSDALIDLLKDTPGTDHCAIHPDLIPAAVNHLQGNAEEIEAFLNITKTFTKAVGTKHKDIKVLALQSTSRLISSTLASCGIINEAYMRWIEQVRDEKLEFAYRELEDVLMMTEEIKFHVRRFDRQIALYLGKNESPLTRQIVELQKQVQAIPRSEVDEEGITAYLAGTVAS
ncbi:MAG: HD domain-containing protein [Agarilytica sp.]